MKVLLKQTIEKLGIIGDVVDVKPGYARNYLLPQRLATEPTPANIKAIEAAKQRYLEEQARLRAEVEKRAELLHGKEVTISARANEEGHLYGSVGPAQIAAALAKEQVFIEPENIVLDEPIRQLDKYDLEVRFAEDIQATIHVWVVPLREPGQDEAAGAAEAAEGEHPAGPAPAPASEPGAEGQAQQE